MAIRTFRPNFRTRDGVDPDLWNTFWCNLEGDLDDIIGSGTDLIRDVDLGLPDMLDDYDIAVSGTAGREDI